MNTKRIVALLSIGFALTQISLEPARADYYSAVTNLNPVAYYRLEDAGTAPPADLATNLGSMGGIAYYYAPVASAQPLHPASSLLACSTDSAATFDAAAFNAVILPASPANAGIYSNGSFTAEAWIKPASVTSGATPLSHYWIDSIRYGWYLAFTPAGNLRMLLYAGVGTASVGILTNLNVTFTAGQTYHVAAVVTPSNATLYVNGIASETRTLTAPMGASGRHFTVGAQSSALGSYFSGTIDEVAIYSSALSASDIQNRYNTGSSSTPADYSALVLAQTPKVYLRLNEPAYTKLGQNDLSLPVATNLISPGTFDGQWQVGSTMAVDGPRPPQFSGFGANNKAGRFSPFHKGIVVPSSPANNKSSITLAAWVRREVTNYSSATPMNVLVACGQLGNTFAHLNADKPQGARQGAFTYYTITLAPGVSSWAPFLLDQWEHWVYVSQTTATGGNTQWIYVNGVEQARGNSTLNINDNGNPFIISGMDNTKPDGFPGSVDEVAVFTNSLTAAQVLDLYKAALPVPIIQSHSRTPANPVYVGYNVTNTVVATSPLPMTYQWRKGGTPIDGATNATFAINGVTSNDSGTYDVVVSNANGPSTSLPIVLNVLVGPPVIVSQPQSAVRLAGASHTFSVTASGVAPFTNWWYKDGNLVFGPTVSSTYAINPLALSHSGIYRVAVSNSLGGVVSSNVTLAVEAQTNFTSLVLYRNPIAYWRLNETNGTTAYDYVGGLNGTRLGGATSGVGVPPNPGLPGTNTCYQFDGASGWVQAGGNVELNSGAMTLIALVKRNGTQVSASRIAGGFGGGRVDLEVDSNGQIGAWFGNIGGRSGLTGLTLPDQTWCFVAFVVTNSVGTVYMHPYDGFSTMQQGFSDAIGNTISTFPMNIGRDTTGGGYFNGQIDEVSVYRQAFSAEEVAEMDNMLLVGPNAPEFVTKPASAAAFPGATITFSADAIGAPIAWQWKHAGTNLPGGTQKTLALTNVYYTDAGTYAVEARNGVGVTNASATLTVALPNPTFANLTNGLVVHLKFDGNYLDSSGRGNHGTNSGASLVAGRIGSGGLHYQTDTASSTYNYVTLGTPADLQLDENRSFSVAYWVKLPTSTRPGNLPFLCNAVGGYGNFGYTFAPGASRGGWSYALNDSGTTVGLLGPYDTINNGSWHSLVHTFDRAGNAAVTFLDGLQVDARTLGSLYSLATTMPANLGQDATGYYAVDGQADLDDLGIWTRALSAVEAQTLYRVGRDYDRTFDTYGPVVLTLRISGASVEILWQAGTLEQSDDLRNPAGWTDVPGATPPYFRVAPGLGSKFYRVRL